ncbi:MAG: GTP cyclohydrolase II [Myxococcota bacterium]
MRRDASRNGAQQPASLAASPNPGITTAMAQDPATSPSSLEQLVEADKHHRCRGVGAQHICVRVAAVAELPTRFGAFRVVAFHGTSDGKDHIALVRGHVLDAEDVPVRMHSECLTGDALGSLRCDCRDQLESALKSLGGMERGLLLYLHQEGRGIGLLNKIRAYALQDRGLDTVDANLALGFRADERDYATAAHMLHSLRVRSVRLMTNNPAKMHALEQLGVRVTGRIPHVMPPNPHNVSYLRTKAARAGHWLGHLPEQDEPILRSGMNHPRHR